MKAYVVGGAVRDELLGLSLKDKDYVVVGATPEEMVRRGFKPVGRDFPVFLHPQTKEEYALARTERKSGRGYRGFTVHAAPDVTLEDDLRRRDLTINAMARDLDSGVLIDPFHGKQDLEKKILRHVSEAFAEDPVRILRVARFAARFGFRVASETMALMKTMVQSGEADYLVPERVWQEFARGLAEPHPEKMFEVLDACGLADQLLDGVKPVLLMPRSLPFKYTSATWRAASNSMKTFFPLHESGAVNVFRYQVRPPHWFCSPRCPASDQSSNVSQSLNVCGSETVAQLRSSNSGCWAPSASAFTNFQAGLKFSISRSPASAAERGKSQIRLTPKRVLWI